MIPTVMSQDQQLEKNARLFSMLFGDRLRNMEKPATPTVPIANPISSGGMAAAANGQ